MRARFLHHVMRPLAAVVLLALLPLYPTKVPAATDAQPILEISGKIKNVNGEAAAVFDLAGLRQIGVSEMQTSTPWTDGRPVFEGVLMRDLLEAVGADGETAVAIALNDYRMEIPISDFRNYPVLLAFKMNGKRLKVRDKGPLWIVYPRDEYPELRSKTVQYRWVWQLKSIDIQ